MMETPALNMYSYLLLPLPRASVSLSSNFSSDLVSMDDGTD
jgi:hypothetical protein